MRRGRRSDWSCCTEATGVLRGRGRPGAAGRRRRGLRPGAGRGVPGAHRAAEPRAQRLPRRLAEQALAEADAADARRGGRRPAPAARRAGRDQGRRRRRRRAHTLGPRRTARRRRARDAEVVRRAARRGRGRRRQDERARADDLAVHGDAELRRDAQPVGARPHAGRLERRLGRGGRRGPVRRRAGLRRRPARSASRRASAGCSASSPSATASRSAPKRDAGTGSASSGRSRGGWPTPRCSSTPPPTRAGGGFAAAAARAARAGCAIAVSTKVPPGAWRGWAPSSARRSRRRPGCCARSATRSPSARSTTGRRRAEPAGALPARHPRRRRGVEHPERLERRTREMARLGAPCRPALRRAGARRRGGDRRAHRRDLRRTPTSCSRPGPPGRRSASASSTGAARCGR